MLPRSLPPPSPDGPASSLGAARAGHHRSGAGGLRELHACVRSRGEDEGRRDAAQGRPRGDGHAHRPGETRAGSTVAEGVVSPAPEGSRSALKGSEKRRRGWTHVVGGRLHLEDEMDTEALPFSKGPHIARLPGGPSCAPAGKGFAKPVRVLPGWTPRSKVGGAAD